MCQKDSTGQWHGKIMTAIKLTQSNVNDANLAANMHNKAPF